MQARPCNIDGTSIVGGGGGHQREVVAVPSPSTGVCIPALEEQECQIRRRIQEMGATRIRFRLYVDGAQDSGVHLLDDERRLLPTLLMFYEEERRFAQLRRVLSEQRLRGRPPPETDRVSLRDLEYLVVRHPGRATTLTVPYKGRLRVQGAAETEETTQTLELQQQCTLQAEYDYMNKTYHRTLFDVFGRARESGAPRLCILLWMAQEPTARIVSVVKQLHFLKWAAELGLFEYVRDHRRLLRRMMSESRQGGKQRRQSAAAHIPASFASGGCVLGTTTTGTGRELALRLDRPPVSRRRHVAVSPRPQTKADSRKRRRIGPHRIVTYAPLSRDQSPMVVLPS